MLLLVVVAMSAGMAAAAQMAVTDPIDLVPGQYVGTTATISSINDATAGRTLVVTVVAGTATDLTFKVGNQPATNGGITYPYTPTGSTHDIQVEIQVCDTSSSGTEYELYYKDFESGAGDTASATVYGTSIPEFATIAIPVVALLGLVLFMRRKKE